MPEWIHGRAEHLLAKNPDMKKSTAFAIATQQAESTGHTPKGYGTPEGRATAKAKYDTPHDDQQKANPGGLETPKLKKAWALAFFDELDKIAAMPPPLPAAARGLGGAVKSVARAVPPPLPAAAMKPKTYGEEGFQALMQGARGAANPFASMKLGSARLAFQQALAAVS